VELTRNARGPKPACVTDRFVMEEGAVAYTDPRWRKAEEVTPARCCSVSAGLCPGEVAADVAPPAVAVQCWREGGPAASGAIAVKRGPVVEHRADQQLESNRHLLVVRPLGYRGGQPTARTGTTHGDPVGVYVERVGVVTQPGEAW
jgi:hypothetical protein